MGAVFEAVSDLLPGRASRFASTQHPLPAGWYPCSLDIGPFTGVVGLRAPRPLAPYRGSRCVLPRYAMLSPVRGRCLRRPRAYFRGKCVGMRRSRHAALGRRVNQARWLRQPCENWGDQPPCLSYTREREQDVTPSTYRTCGAMLSAETELVRRFTLGVPPSVIPALAGPVCSSAPAASGDGTQVPQKVWCTRSCSSGGRR
jgi:hypothetical protein